MRRHSSASVVLLFLLPVTASAWWLSAVPAALVRRFRDPVSSIQHIQQPLYNSAKNSAKATSSTPTNNKHQKDRLPKPSEQDVEFQAWADRNGIFAPSIQCLTTSLSVGQRGLFAMKNIQKGEVVASIPKDLIFKSDHTKANGYADGSWAAHMTQKVLMVDKTRDKRLEWVENWSGGGCMCLEDALNTVESLEEDNPKLYKQVRQCLGKRIQTWLHLANEYQLHEHDFPLYNLVYSRSCYMGPTWGISSQVVGIIPLFDMLNHDSKRQNVRLVSAAQAFAEMPKKAQKPPLDDKDMLLIATKDIEEGTELLTEYIHEDDGDSAMTKTEIQAQKLVQWGFL